MAKNERIIAQDLAELRYALQTENTNDIENLCHILKREISKYPVKPGITSRLESVTDYCNISDVDMTLDAQLDEITSLIDILTSH